MVTTRCIHILKCRMVLHKNVQLLCINSSFIKCRADNESTLSMSSDMLNVIFYFTFNTLLVNEQQTAASVNQPVGFVLLILPPHPPTHCSHAHSLWDSRVLEKEMLLLIMEVLWYFWSTFRNIYIQGNWRHGSVGKSVYESKRTWVQILSTYMKTGYNYTFLDP